MEALRLALYQVVADHDGNLLAPAVIEASQQLDAEITAEQLRRAAAAKGRDRPRSAPKPQSTSPRTAWGCKNM
ncbi:Spo0E family sporulation regulatory protein-aspartic acid phosphatase [Alicyclobacillus cycloheptanicus]|uniref:Spo0E family sporulation regulatory protein-aspartic acid phosphatase n=1 Tax=Alicyclobacillus cycloheptanicus TaxID=1457 RepID=UPI003908B3AD